MAEQNLLQKLQRHFPEGEFPQTPGVTQLRITIGLTEAFLATAPKQHEAFIYTAMEKMRQLGFASSLDMADPYAHLRFIFAKQITLEQTLLPLPLESSAAQLLFGRGFDSGEYHTIFGITILSRTPSQDTHFFTTAFEPESRYLTNFFAPLEQPLLLRRRPIISGYLITQGDNFILKIDQSNTSPEAVGSLQLQMKKEDRTRRPIEHYDLNALTHDQIVHEWMQHFVVDTPQGGSKYYAHFPQPRLPLLVLR